MGTQVLDRQVGAGRGRAAESKRWVGPALESLDGQSRALASFSLVEGSPTRCWQGKAHNFIADKRMAPPEFH